MKLSDIKKLRQNNGGQNTPGARVLVSREKMKPILYWETPFVMNQEIIPSPDVSNKFLVKKALVRNINIESIFFRKKTRQRVQTLIKHMKFVKRYTYESLSEHDYLLKHLGIAQKYARRLKTIDLKGGSLFRMKSVLLPKISSGLCFKEILIDDFILKNLKNNILILRHLKNYKQLERVSLLQRNYKSRISDVEVSKKLMSMTINNLKRLSKLEFIKIHLPTGEFAAETCYAFSNLVGKLPFLRLYANFKFEQDPKIISFLEGLRGYALDLFDVSWGFQTNEEISKRLGELVGIKRLALHFREETPPKLIRNIRKIKQIEEFTWSVNCSHLFYSSAETIIKGNMGLVEAVVHYKLLKCLEIDVYQSGNDVYKLLGTGTSDMKNLKILKLNFPYHSPTASLSLFFSNFTNPVVQSVKFSLEVGHEEEVKSLGICLRKLSKNIKNVSVHFIGDFRTEHAAELYQHLKLLENIESLELVYASTIRGKGGKPLICEVLGCLGKLKNINLNLDKMFAENEIEPLLKTLSRLPKLERFTLTNQIGKLKNTTINLMEGFARRMPDNLTKLQILFPESRYNFNWKRKGY